MKLRQCNYFIGPFTEARQCKRLANVRLISSGVEINGRYLITPGTESWLCKQHAKMVRANKNSWK